MNPRTISPGSRARSSSRLPCRVESGSAAQIPAAALRRTRPNPRAFDLIGALILPLLAGFASNDAPPGRRLLPVEAPAAVQSAFEGLRPGQELHLGLIQPLYLGAPAELAPQEVQPRAIRPPGYCGTCWRSRAEDPEPDRTRAGLELHALDLPPADTLPEPTVVDVLFLYTPQAVSGEGNEEGIHRRVLEAVAETNFCLTNSLINVQIHPVWIGLINYPESGDMGQDLTRLANGSGGLENAHTLRSLYKADLVCLITELENAGVGGWARDATPPRGNQATGFTVVRRKLLGQRSTLLAHELGHLLGCDHDREHAGDLNSNFFRTRKPYIFGHRFEVEGVTYRDVMAYDPGIEVPYFSNPRLDLDGVRMGVPEGEALPADGARTINETAPYVARYRTALSRVAFASARFVTSEDAGPVTVLLTRTGDLTTGTRVTVRINPGGSATEGQDYVRPASLQVEFAPDQAAAELLIDILPDDLEEGEEQIRLGFSAVVGNHGLGQQSGAEVIILDAGIPPAFADLAFPEGPLSVPESAGEARIPVRLEGAAPDEPLTLPYRTVEGSARAGQDFTARSGALNTAGGVTEWAIAVPLLPHPEPGPDRTFALVVGTRTNTVRIVDEQRRGALVASLGRDLTVDGGINSQVRADGHILVWGDFTRLGGVDRTAIALLHPDGSVDESFVPPEILRGHRPMEGLGTGAGAWGGAWISTVQPQPDGRLLLAGTFSRVNGQRRSNLIRLHPDGSLDEAFGRELVFDGNVNTLALQPDGRILVGGSFEHINGRRRPFIARLLPDGTADDSFQPNGGPTSTWTVWINAMAVLPDGGILIGGNFDRVDGLPILNLARLKPDGILDPAFRPRSGVSGPVERIRLQPDGRIVICGFFDTAGGRTSRRLARLNADGSGDFTFRPPNPYGDVSDVVSLPDGRILVSGAFTTVANQPRRFLALLNADGTLDSDFDPGIGTDTFAGMYFGWGEPASILADGTLHLSGAFQRYNGLPAPNLLRIRLGDVLPSLAGARRVPEGLTITVHGLPGGVYPIEATTDFTTWHRMGEVRLEGYDHAVPFGTPRSEPQQFYRARPLPP